MSHTTPTRILLGTYDTNTCKHSCSLVVAKVPTIFAGKNNIKSSCLVSRLELNFNFLFYLHEL